MTTKINLKQIFKAFLLFSLIVFTVLFLIPTEALPEQSVFKWWDKAQHIIVFMSLSLVAFFAYPQNFLKQSAYLMVYGAIIEVLQYLTNWRQEDFFDWIADVTGILIIYLVLEIIRRIFPNKLKS